MKYLVMAIIEAEDVTDIKLPEGTLAHAYAQYKDWGDVERDLKLDSMMDALESIVN